MKNSYFVFFCLLLACLEARKLSKICPLIPATTTPATNTTTPSTNTTTPVTNTTTPSTNTTIPVTDTTPTPVDTIGGYTNPSIGSSERVYGAWLLTEDIDHPTEEGWYPKLRKGNPFNTYWLSFLNPNTIFVNGETTAPSVAFTKFSLNRDADEGPRSTDRVFYSIGGYTYSQEWLNNSWAMFSSNENAIKFAKSVASWKQLYKMDGFDLDWEYGQLTAVEAEAVYTFLVTLRTLDPTILISVEEGGFPQFSGAAAIKHAISIGQLDKLINAVDYFNVMYYSNDLVDNSLAWVQKSWQKDCSVWCALGTKIPSKKIVLGLPGCCSKASTQASLKTQLCAKGDDGDFYAGYMIWDLVSDSDVKIFYSGVCEGSLGCALDPNNAANFELPAC